MLFTFRRAAVGVALLVGVVIACDDPDSYVYTARKYNAADECLEPYKPVEAVNGSSVSTACAPACLTVGRDTFVSVVCPPFPVIATALAPDAAECIAALRAYDASACGDDADGGGDEEEGEEEEEDADAAAGSDDAADSSDDVTDSGADADGD